MTVTPICMKEKMETRCAEFYCLVIYGGNGSMFLLLQVGRRVLLLSLVMTAMLMPH